MAKGKIKPEQRNMARSFVAGAIVLAILGVITAITFNAINGLPFRPTTVYRAEFNDVHSLAVNDDVRQNSKRIGRVSELAVHDGRALVTMEIDGDYTIHQDAHAAIWDVSALAAKFVELSPGTPQAGALAEGSVIPAAKNTDSADIYELLNVFDPKTREATSGFLRQFGGGQVGHGEDAHDFLSHSPAILTNIGTVSADMASPTFDFPRLIKSSDSLVSRLRGREQQVSGLIRQVDQTFQAINADDGAALKTTLAKAPGTLRALTPALDALTPPLADTGTAMASLRPGAEGLGQATPDLRGFFREAPAVADDFTPWSEDLRPVVEDLTDTASDAHKIVDRAKDTFDYLADPLRVLAPYGPEMGTWMTRMHSFVSLGAEPGKRYAHLVAAGGAPTVSGGLINSGVKRFTDAYPDPGESERQHLGFGQLPAGIGVKGSNR